MMSLTKLFRFMTKLNQLYVIWFTPSLSWLYNIVMYANLHIKAMELENVLYSTCGVLISKHQTILYKRVTIKQ